MSAVPEHDPLTDPMPAEFYSGGQPVLRPAQLTRHEIGPDSWLASAAAGVAALRAKSLGPAATPPTSDPVPAVVPGVAADPVGWDPLSDPWPGEDLEPTHLEQVVREEVDPLGLAYPTWFQARSLMADAAQTSRDEASPTSPDDASDAETTEVDVVVAGPTEFVGVSAEVEHALLQTQPYDLWNEHPSGPLPQAGAMPANLIVPESPASLMSSSAVATATVAFDLTLTGPLGGPEFGFAEGRWLSITDTGTRPVSVSTVLIAHPEKAGQITQLACWWLRENPKRERAIDLATELSLAVSDLVRRARD
ncbi:MAG: hypothetical protein ACT4P1_12505 [Sporichthyaceae bacterium]